MYRLCEKSRRNITFVAIRFNASVGVCKYGDLAICVLAESLYKSEFPREENAKNLSMSGRGYYDCRVARGQR